jgi:hypothetical protein
MANTLTDLCETSIMPLALVQLRESCVMPALVYSSFSDETVKHKQTIRIPAPQNMGDADDVATDLTNHGETQDTALDDGYVDITMSNWKHKQFSMTDKEIEESVSDGILPSAAEGAVKSLANAVDKALLDLYKDIPYFYGTAGVTPSKGTDITGVRKILRKNLCPNEGNQLVLDNDAEALFLNAFSKANEVGSTEALRQASLGQLYGFNIFADQLVPYHNAGTFADVPAAAVNSAVAAGATTMNIDGGSGSETIKDGDLFTVDGVAGQYVFTADKTATTGAITGATFTPAAPTGGFPDNAKITITGSHVPNLAFNRNAMALAVRRVDDTKYPSESSTIVTQTDPVSGLNLRLETWRKSGAAARKWRFDILFGVKLIRPELAARLLG